MLQPFVTPCHSDQKLLLHKITENSSSYEELLPWANQLTKYNTRIVDMVTKILYMKDMETYLANRPAGT